MRSLVALTSLSLVLVACSGGRSAPRSAEVGSPIARDAGAAPTAAKAEDEAVREALVRQCGDNTLSGGDDVRALLVKACSLSDGESCERLGHVYLCGAGVRADMPIAFKFYERACTLRSDTGCVVSSVMMEHGIGVAKDEKRSFEILDRSCKARMMGACRTLAVTLVEQDPEANADRAMGLYAKACDGGFGEACDDLSRVYAAGWGTVAKDDAKAYTHAKKGCELGNANACGQLGVLLVLGVGVTKDAPTGLRTVVAACEKGSAIACESAGSVLATGAGVAADGQRGVDFFQRACRMGLGRACRKAADLGAARGDAPMLAPPAHGHF